MSRISTIGIIAPASACKTSEEAAYRAAIKFLEDQGLKLILARNLFEIDEACFTAGTAKRRSSEFHRIWSHSRVETLLAMRGGYGCIQLLENIDYRYLSRNPKPLLGYSDLTTLFLALAEKCRLQTFHTPMLSSIHKWSHSRSGQILSSKSFFNLLANLPASGPSKTKQGLRWISLEEILSFNPSLGGTLKKQGSIVTDKASELRVVGGNLSIICSLLGTEYIPDFKNTVLLLEDCNEPKYKIDRMLQQLHLSGIFDEVLEIWLGTPLKAEFPQSFLHSIAKANKIKLLSNMPFGHGTRNISLCLN
jgi:muramoyltetrapeptide carboxypeptidase